VLTLHVLDQSNVGITGVLLAVGAVDGTRLYWHIVPDGSAYGPAMDAVSGLYPIYSNPHIHVVVSGSTYEAFVNGSMTPATVLTTSAFDSGQVALYDNNLNQSFDNVTINTAPVPEPTSLAVLGIGLAALVYLSRSSRRQNAP
jgi:hypothetical protein